MRVDVSLHVGLAVTLARQFRGLGVPDEDLQQEACLGLLEASTRFDPEQGFTFPSYASHYARARLFRSVARQGRAVRLPAERNLDLGRISRARDELFQRLQREPSPQELARATGAPSWAVDVLLGIERGPQRLDEPVSQEEGALTLQELLPDPGEGPEEELASDELQEALHRALSSLSERERRVLVLHFGLGEKREHSLDEIAEEFGVSRERIRQLRARALERLRGSSALRELAA